MGENDLQINNLNTITVLEAVQGKCGPNSAEDIKVSREAFY